MFIKCEKCGAVFDIDASLVNPKRAFKCGVCAHTFYATPVEMPPENTVLTEQIPPVTVVQDELATNAPIPFSTQEENEPTDSAPEISLPEEFKPVTERKKSHKLFWFFILLLLMGGLAGGVLFFTPDSLKQLFSPNIPETIQPVLPADLKIIDTSFRIVPDAQGNQRLLVQGALYNPSSEAQPTQAFWIELYDADNTLIYTQPVTPLQPRIMGESTLPFYTEITPIPDTVKRTEIVFK